MRQKGIFVTLVVKVFMLLLAGNLLASSQPYISGHGINFGVGNKYHQEMDLNLSGPTKPLVFKRTYNSQSTDTGILGYGWTSTLGERLIIDTTKIILVQSGGRYVHFIDNGSGAWINESGKVRTITAITEGYQLTEPNGSVLLFDSTGNITEKRDSNNNNLVYSYNGSQLVSIADNFGRSITLTYNANGFLEILATPIGNFTYTYDANNNLEYVYKPDSTHIQYLYEETNDVHNLTGIINEKGIRTLTVGYDASDRVISSDKASGFEGVTIEYLPNLERNVTKTGDPAITDDDIVSTYQLEVKNGIVRVGSFTGPGCSACGASTGLAYLYDSRQRITQVTDARNNVTTYTYQDDPVNGDTKTKTEAVGTPQQRTTVTTYVPGTDKIETISKSSIANPGQQAVITLQYDAQGNLSSRTETGYDGTTPINRITTYGYDSFGRIQTIDGPRADVNDITLLAYYPNMASEGNNRGHLNTVTNGLGHVTIYSNYNAFGKAELIDPPYGDNIVLAYDLLGRLQSKTQGSIITTYEYYNDGKLHIAHLPDSRNITYTYTPTGKPETISDTLGNTITYIYDPYELQGKPERIEIRDPANTLQKYIEYTYEDTGDLNQTIHLGDTLNPFENLDYDPVGNLHFKTNALGKTTEYLHDALNRLTDVIEPVNDTESATTIYKYDSDDNLISVTDAENKQTNYIYDDFGRKTSRTSTDTGWTIYEYDEADNLKSSTASNGITTTYQYDALNRLTAIHYPDSNQDVIFGYDEKGYTGLLTSMQDSTGSSTYNYDVYGRMIRETRFQGGLVFTTDYGYNRNSELTSITYPSGMVITYVRDNGGQVISVTSTMEGITTTLADTITYKPFGPQLDMILGNGLLASDSYNQLYQLYGMTAGSQQDRTYSYYPTGNVQTITDAVEPTASQDFTYDDLSRLKTALGDYGSYSWDYDYVSNRLSQTTGTGTTTYNYEPGTDRLDQILAAETIDNVYDASGNLKESLDINGEGRLYSYSDNNRLTGVSNLAWVTKGKGKKKTTELVDTLFASYGYNGLSQRVIKTLDSGTTHFIYSRNGELLTEYDEVSGNMREYIYLNGKPLAIADIAEEVSEPPVAQEIILDNGETGTSGVGDWTQEFDRKGNEWGSDFLLSSGGMGSTYQWMPIIGQGNYDVYIWFLRSKKNSDIVPYTIYHNGLTNTFTVDQTANGSQWYPLGTFDFLGDGTEYVQVSNANGQTVADAVRFVEQVAPAQPTLVANYSYIHTDHLGTPQMMTDSAGAVVWKASYTPFGEAVIEVENVQLNLRFPGQYWDAETGLHYNWNRYYDPATGRYITADPIGLEGGNNLYLYVDGNPVNGVDLTGLYQMCHRPVEILPGRHCYGSFADGTTSSFGPDGVGPEKDKDNEDTVCTEPQEPEKDDCIKRAMKKCKAKSYRYTKFNCCHCLEQAMKECGTSIPASDWPNYPINPGPQPGEPGYDPDPVYGPTL